MPKQKINPNRASKKELLELKGIGEAKADVIKNFVETGGTFNTLEEFQKVAKLQPAYLAAIKEILDLPWSHAPIDTPFIPLPYAPPPIIIPVKDEEFSFSIDITRPGGSAPNYEGYKVIIGYKPSYAPAKEIHYAIPATGKIKVKIAYSPLGHLEKEMHIVIISPDGSLIYDSSFQVEQDEKITIGLNTFDDQELLVKINKQPAVNYDGYKLKITSTINKGASGIDTDIASHAIAGTNEINVDFFSFGKVEQVSLDVLSNYGVSLTASHYEWADIPVKDGIKQVEIDLPAPTSISCTVQLVDDPAEYNNPYLDHKAVITYDLKDSQSLEVIRQVENSFPIDAKGQAKIDIRQYGLIQTMKLMVKAPSGETIGQRQITLADIDAGGTIEVKVPPRKLAGMEGIETLPKRPKKISGRVIDIKGERKFNGVQVVIYAARTANPAATDYDPIAIVTTQNEGYFSMETPEGYFADAVAKIGIPRKGNIEAKIFEVPVRLEEDQVLLLKDGAPKINKELFFPANMILVVDTEGADDLECPNNDCKINFHQQKKILDEFSFFTVVRTTEPMIQGYTLEEDGEMTVQDIVNIIPISPDAADNDKNIPLSYRNRSVNKSILLKYINEKKGLTFTTLQKALNESNAKKLRDVIRPQRQVRAIGRHILDLDHAIDWDEDPTIYQAITLAHGHLLHFKQEWSNDGYSLGDLLYSLPLAPGQKKQIVVFDWERREAASKSDEQHYSEGLSNSLIRDRDVNEIVSGSLTEAARGGSTARSSSVSAGIGLGAISGSVGALLGVSGGTSKASSNAWQNSSRNTALNDLQTLRDRTVQSANAVRSQRGTVIHTASQGERFTAETEAVANYNHCHSLTIQYFEVLRHMKIDQRLSSVQECLFIPLVMSPFDFQKILRWREDLHRYVGNWSLRKGFAAIERIDNDYEGSDLPEATYAQENIEFMEGHLSIRFDIPSPVDLEKLEEENEIIDLLQRFEFFFSGISRYYAEFYQSERNKRNALFQQYVAPEIAAALVEYLEIEAMTVNSQYGTESRIALPLDTTLISSFHNGRTHYVTLRQSGPINALSRQSIKSIRIKKAAGIKLSNGKTLAEILPVNTRVIIESGEISYRAKYNSDILFRKSRIQDDLIGYSTQQNDNEFVRIDTPLNRNELRNPRNEDLEKANSLHDHLNDNLEFYHKAIWMNMSPERRFMFLDGIQVTDYSDPAYRLGIVRSVASVVENKVIGIVGNSLVMPVAPGFRLDPNTRGKDIDLHALYKPTTPIEPIHVSIPTKGVFAEAVMGSCNSCEKIEEDRFWKWEDHPIPDSPTGFGTISTDSRRAAPLDTTASTPPPPMVNIQNAPASPDPSGLAAASQLLATSSFKDLTGLAGNQTNAQEALKASFAATQAFGAKAAEMASLGATLEAIKSAKENGMIDDSKAKERTAKTLQTKPEKTSDAIKATIDQVKTIQDMINTGVLPKDIGKKIMDKAVEAIDPSKGGLMDNEVIQTKVEESSSIEYSSEGESITISGSEAMAPAVDESLQKFLVHFARPRIFVDSGGARLDYGGHFGFDSLEDEYIHPMIMVSADNNGAAINAKRPLCKDIPGLKQTYLDGCDEIIAPYGRDYYPAWLAIMPYTTEVEFAHGSRMHKNGARLSLEVEEIDELFKNANEICFETTSDFLKLSTTSIPVSEFLKKKKQVRDLDTSTNQTKKVYILEDALTVSCVGGVLTEHTAIDVIAKGDDREEKVGKLMVYANDHIPKAEIVMVQLRLDNESPQLNKGKDFHYILKNRSFNQALVRAEIVATELFDLTQHADKADVQAFIAAYKGTPIADVAKFVDEIKALYENYGANLQGGSIDDSTRTFMFLTELDAGTISGSSDVENATLLDKIEMFFRGAKIESVVWSNFLVVFNDGLNSQRTFIHEIGHSLSLYHPFQEGGFVPGVFHQGFTDKIMDYTWRVGGTAGGALTSAGKNPYCKTHNKMWRLFKYEWDRIRKDRSLIYDY